MQTQNKKILIVAATYAELAPSLDLLNRFEIDYLITGVGMVATAFALGRRLNEKKYDILINIGIGGALDRGLALGSIVRINADKIYSFGAESQNEFLSIEELGFGKSVFYEKVSPKINNLLSDLPTMNGVTVNAVHGNEKSIFSLTQTTPLTTVESMEGAAFFYAADQLDILRIQIRAVSNYIELRNKANWDIPLAILNVNTWLTGFLKTLLKDQYT